MGTEEKEEEIFPELTEILDRTRELTALLKRTESYQNYCRDLAKLKREAGSLQTNKREGAR